MIFIYLCIYVLLSNVNSKVVGLHSTIASVQFYCLQIDELHAHLQALRQMAAKQVNIAWNFMVGQDR
jgi:hypothetical protein